MSPFKLNSIMLVIASSFAMNAIAEEITPEKLKTEEVTEEEIERIFIRGTKQELTLQEVDASVELFSAERLSSERIVDLDDALVRIPNVTGSTGSSNNITIRGIGRTGSTGSGQGVTSNVYIDGSPLSSRSLVSGVTSLWDTEQVEVLRGSQSSVQGRNALAGAIVVSTADPTYVPDGKFRLTYAEDNTYQIAGAYGNAIIDNQLAFRLAADIQATDGIIENEIFNQNRDEQDRLLLRGKLLFEPEAIDDLSIKLTVDYNDIDVGNTALAVASPAAPDSPLFASFDPFDLSDFGENSRNKSETTRFILDTHYALSDHWSIKNILTSETTETDSVFGSLELLQAQNPFVDQLTTNNFNDDIITAELRFTFEYENITGVIGGYYFENEVTQTGLTEILLAPIASQQTGGLVAINPADTATLITGLTTITDTENKAIFAQVRIDLNESFTLDLGIRYDDEQFDNSGVFNEVNIVTPEECTATAPGFLFNVPLDSVTLTCLQAVNAFGGEALEQTPQTAKYNAWLPKATLTYNINTDHSVFVSAQRGYRAGGSFVTTVDNPSDEGFIQIVDTYDPEYLNTVEIGSRSVFADGDITFNANIFYSTYKDQQIGLPGENINDPNDDIITNAAESSISGAEFSFAYFITQEIDIYASVGLLKAEFDDFIFADQGEFTNLEGNTLANSPEVNASIGINWVSQTGWFANVSAFYSGSRFSDIDNLENEDFFELAINADMPVPAETASSFTEKVDSYINVNTRFGYEFDNTTIYVFGTNIFDEEVITSADFGSVNERTGEVEFRNRSGSFNILAPRSFGIGIDYEF